MYKVFIDDNVFYASINAQKSIFKEDVLILSSENAHQTFDLLKATSNPVLVNFFSEKKCWKFFNTHFKLISAAGGVVKNKKNELLFIYRNGFWDLPKGKIEKGEKKKIAAVREVEEECGISAPKIIKGLTTTYHTYEYKEETVLKQSFWYTMEYDGYEKLVPQLEEGIERVVWMSKKEAFEKLPLMYSAIQDIVKQYYEEQA